MNRSKHPFQIYSIFLRVVSTNLWFGVLLPFFFRRREEKVPFYPRKLRCKQLHSSSNSRLRSIPFLNFSRDHLRSILGITNVGGSFVVPCTLWNFPVIISTVSVETSFPFKHTMFWQNPRISLSKYMYTNFNNHWQPCLMIFLVLLAFSAYLRSPCTGKLIHVLGFALLPYSDWLLKLVLTKCY